MKRTGILVAMLALSGFAFAESTAHAAFRWPWESRSDSNKPKPAATAVATPLRPAATPIVQQPAAPVGEEQVFAEKIHEVNQKEIAFGNLALSRASSSAVKDYARMLVDDHTKADAMITKRAQELGLTFALPPSISHDPDYQTLTTKSGTDFDIVFLGAMVRGHDALIPDLARFKEQESNHPFHAELVQLFDTVKHHRAQAKELLDRERTQRHDVKGQETPAPHTHGKILVPTVPKISR